MIKIVPYNQGWPQAFEAEARSLRNTFGNLARRIEHVGSTSVPGLAAKPVIDIQVSVESLRTVDAYAKCLALLGYKFVSDGEFDLVYPFFTKPEIWASTHHVHLCIAGGMQETQHLAFRNYLRRHPEVAVNYAALKRKLATEHNATTRASRENYSLAKTDFVHSVLASAGSTSSEAQ